MSKKPTPKMLEILARIARGGRVQWSPYFRDSVDAHSATVAALLHRGLVQTQPGTSALGLTDKGWEQLAETHR